MGAILNSWWAKDDSPLDVTGLEYYGKTHISAKKLNNNFPRKGLCKSFYYGYNYFGLHSISFKPNIPRPITCNGLSSYAHQEFSIAHSSKTQVLAQKAI